MCSFGVMLLQGVCDLKMLLQDHYDYPHLELLLVADKPTSRHEIKTNKTIISLFLMKVDWVKFITMSKATNEKMMKFSIILMYHSRWRTDWYCTLRLCSLLNSIEIAALFSLTIFGSAYYFSKYHYLKKYQTLTLAAREFISYILLLNLMNLYKYHQPWPKASTLRC